MLTMQKFFGSQLRTFRTQHELSQIELAERIDVSKETIGKIERGQAAPSFRTIDKICRELQKPPSSFFQKGRDVLDQPTSTAMEKLLSKAAKLDDTEINWIIELIETAKKRP